MLIEPQQKLQKLMPIFHHSPMAMAEISGQGQMRQVNPKVIQLIMPMAMQLGLPGDNILDVLMGYLPTLGQSIASFDRESGLIIDQEPYRIRFTIGQTVIKRHFSLTIDKISSDSLLVFILDVTDFLVKVDAMRQRTNDLDT